MGNTQAGITALWAQIIYFFYPITLDNIPRFFLSIVVDLACVNQLKKEVAGRGHLQDEVCLLSRNNATLVCLVVSIATQPHSLS